MKFIVCTLTVLLLIRCAKDSATGGTAFSEAHPSAFAIASPTASASRDARLSTINPSASRAVKRGILDALFAATALPECAVKIQLMNAGNANCYGPSMTYADHPNVATPNTGSLPGGDTGIWEAADGSGQACTAAQLNSRLNGTASYADAALFATASMLCAARASAMAPPAAGASLDVTSAMTGLVTINASVISITSATLARDADTADGFPVYVSNLVGTSGTTTYSIRMKHVRTAPLNATYRGKATITVAANDATKPQNCSAGTATGHVIATSVEYEKTSATAEKFVLRDAQFCGSDADPFKSATDFTVDHSKKFPGVAKGWANNANYLAGNVDPSTLVGNYAYAWSAGSGDSNVRALNLNLAAARGAMTGTAFFGFGAAMSSTNDGSIDRMICNWAGPGNNHTGITKAQKQTISRADGAALFLPVASNITYDPANLCEDNSAGFTVTWNAVSGTPTTRAANTTTLDLVDVSTIATAFTAPTAPTAVD